MNVGPHWPKLAIIKVAQHEKKKHWVSQSSSQDVYSYQYWEELPDVRTLNTHAVPTEKTLLCTPLALKLCSKAETTSYIRLDQNSNLPSRSACDMNPSHQSYPTCRIHMPFLKVDFCFHSNLTTRLSPSLIYPVEAYKSQLVYHFPDKDMIALGWASGILNCQNGGEVKF